MNDSGRLGRSVDSPPTPALFAVLGPVMNTGYEPDAAHDAHTRILAFFDRHLTQDAPPPTTPGA